MGEIERQIATLRLEFKEEIASVANSKEVEQLKVKYLGKKGPVPALMRSLRDCSKDERPQLGQLINELKEEITKTLDERLNILDQKELKTRLEQEHLDVTLPGRQRFLGRKHPIYQILDEVIDILSGLGFSMQYTPEIETDYYNFGGLNFSPDHPARDMQDTFYLTDNLLLRTHTTTIQQHIMENHTPPIRIISIGKCYRNETITARSHVFFFQVDGFYVDKKVTFADLMATLEEFYSKLFKQKISLRVRPSYFPFVEPGMEVDISCTFCEGKGCFICKKSGWLEVCGAGMVHPKVLKAGGVDPEIYSGFAWGGGIERIFMLRHGINDIRLFTENDTRFLSQFN